MKSEKIKPLLIHIGVNLALVFIIVITYALNIRNGTSNLDSIGLQELLMTLLIASFLSVCISLFFYLIFYNNKLFALTSSLIVIITMFLYQNITNIISPILGDIAINSNLKYRIFYLLAIILLLTILYFSVKTIGKKNKLKIKKIYNGISLVLFILLIYNLINLTFNVTQTWDQRGLTIRNFDSSANTVVNKNLPNIYYIVLDRHSSENQLKDRLGYDNTLFTKDLEQQGFYVNKNAFSAYPYTAQSIASTLNASYLNQLSERDYQKQTYNALFSLSKNSSVVRELKNIGYKYTIIGNWYGTSNGSKYADKLYWNGAKIDFGFIQLNLSEFVDSFIAKNFIAGILGKFNILISNHGLQALKQLDTLNDYANKENENGRGEFIFAHILLPHPPYVFNADGSPTTLDSSNSNNRKEVKQKYLNQLVFIDNQIKNITNKIVKNSKNKSIVVLLSDEGYYPQEGLVDKNTKSDNPDMTKWLDEDLKAKFGILAAFHLPEVPEGELKINANSTNVFRLILNNYFGYKLSYLPECNYALLKNGQPFSYSNITSRLNQKPDQSCSQYEGHFAIQQ